MRLSFPRLPPTHTALALASLAVAVTALGVGTSSCAHAEAAATEPSHTSTFVAHNQPASQPALEGTEPQVGLASWYGGKLAGRRTANGERFDPRAMTAAHRTLPFGTWVEVTRRDTRQRVRVRITDRGPYKEGRIIDLSRAAAERLNMIREGVVTVELRVVDGP